MCMLGLSGAPHVDRRSIKHVLDGRRIVFLHHLDAGVAVLGDLIDVGPLHQPETDIGMPQANAQCEERICRNPDKLGSANLVDCGGASE